MPLWKGWGQEWIQVCKPCLYTIWGTFFNKHNFINGNVLCYAYSLSHGRLFVTPWSVAHQASLSMGMLQARTLEWVAMPSSRGSSQPRDRTQVSRIAGVFFTIWITGEAQEYWSGYPIPSSGDRPDPGNKLGPPALLADSLPAELPGKPLDSVYMC